jgi:hypothetical protein
MSYDVRSGHRPITLVFTKSRTLGGIREALFGRRTVVYFDNTLMGKSDLLEKLFFASLNFKDAPLQITNGTSRRVDITNKSDIDYELELVQPPVGFDAPETVVIKAHHVTPLMLSGNSNEVAQMKTLDAYYRIKNMQVSSEDNLVITFSFNNN